MANDRANPLPGLARTASPHSGEVGGPLAGPANSTYRIPSPHPSIDLWAGDLDAHTPDAVSASVLADDERTRSRQFCREIDRRRFRQRCSILRCTLASYLLIPPEEIRFRRTRSGKPELDNRPKLGFSLSHSANLLLIGVGPGSLGVDVEVIRSLSDVRAIAAQVFTSRELDSIGNLGPRQGLEQFFRLWTAKEAVAKAMGDGFRRDPRALEMGPIPAGFRTHVPSWGPPWLALSFGVTGWNALGALAVPDTRPAAPTQSVVDHHATRLEKGPSWRGAPPGGGRVAGAGSVTPR